MIFKVQNPSSHSNYANPSLIFSIFTSKHHMSRDAGRLLEGRWRRSLQRDDDLALVAIVPGYNKTY